MSTTVIYKGNTIATISNASKILTTAGTWVEGNITITDTSSGGSVTITDEANATGVTCVITSSSTPTPTPTPSGIPLNTELIDYTKAVSNTGIDSNGSIVELEWYYTSDYTAVDPSMTFSYTAGIWTSIGLYDSSKTAVNTINVYNDGTPDSQDGNTAHGTLSGAKLPSNVAYVRLCGTGTTNQYMSLIRIA